MTLLFPRASDDVDAPPSWNWLAQLATEGWASCMSVLPPDLTAALRAEAEALHLAGELSRAGVGRAQAHQLAGDVRRDRILWLDRRASHVQALYLDYLEALRLEVNRALFMGLFSYEAHYAVYERGDFYARHLDAFKGARNRVLSTVFYLNDNWTEADGGQLLIHAAAPDLPEIAHILPELGTLVVFLSEDIPHEVLAAQRNRYSIAGWFRVNDRMLAPGLQAPTLPQVSGNVA